MRGALQHHPPPRHPPRPPARPPAGEIIPQAACKSYGLQIGAYAAPFVRVLMFLTAPLSYPIGWLLDHVLGEEHTALFRCACGVGWGCVGGKGGLCCW